MMASISNQRKIPRIAQILFLLFYNGCSILLLELLAMQNQNKAKVRLQINFKNLSTHLSIKD